MAWKALEDLLRRPQAWCRRLTTRHPLAGLLRPRRTECELRRQQTDELVTRLALLTAQVAADVGDHTTRVKQASGELFTPALESEQVVRVVAGLIEANETLQQRLAESEHRLIEQSQEIEAYTFAARSDQLTGLANRRALDEELERRLAESQRSGTTFSLAVLDIDHFKQFNDSYGHRAGDMILRKVAQTVRDAARGCDFVGRYGGEEFALIMPNTRIDDATRLGEQIRQAVEETCTDVDGQMCRVTASLGTAELTGDENISLLVHRADAALYAAKRAGRNCVHWHNGRTVYPLMKPTDANLARLTETSFADRLTGHFSGETCVGSGKPAMETATCSRTTFCNILRQRLAEWDQGAAPFSIIHARIQYFEELTTRHGGHAVSLALRTVRHYLRAVTGPADVIADLTPDSFAILLPNHRLNEAVAVANRIVESVDQCALPVRASVVQCTLKAGITEVTSGDDVVSLMERTERALQAAEQTCSSNVCCSDRAPASAATDAHPPLLFPAYPANEPAVPDASVL